MSGCSPFPVVLSAEDRSRLEQQVRCYTSPYAAVLRAKIVLMAADGAANVAIAAHPDEHVSVVSRWRKRFTERGLAGLADRPRCRRPRVFSAEVVTAVKAIACQPPKQRGAALSRWSSTELAAQATTEGLVWTLSSSTVRRWLAADVIKPWRYRSWSFPRDPDFAAKATRVLDLYQRVLDGRELANDEYVISADEKSQLQILRRIHPGQPPGPRQVRRVEIGYERGGTLAYLAAYDVHRARLMGRVEPTTGIAPFAALVEQVMSVEPCASARRMFWIVDNGSSPAGACSVARMAQVWPTAALVHLPVHASWLNQAEIVFSIIGGKVIAPADFTDRAALTGRLTAFEPRFNATASPFDWRFTRADLQPMLTGLDAVQVEATRTAA